MLFVPVVTENYMRLDYDTELKASAEFDKTHVLPDRNIITVTPNISVCILNDWTSCFDENLCRQLQLLPFLIEGQRAKRKTGKFIFTTTRKRQ